MGAGGPSPEKRGKRLSTLVERHEGALVLRVSRRMMAINGYDRALALSAQAFVGLIPMFVVISALAPGPVRTSGGARLIASLGLSGSEATAVSVLVQPPSGVGTTTVLGSALVVVSVLGFTRALQRTYLSAWNLPSAGVRGLGHGLISATTLVGGFTALVLLGPALAAMNSHVVLVVIIHAGAATLLWWPVQRALLGGRKSWRALLPGAALTGIGQAVVLALSGIYLPVAISYEAAKYGIVGVAVAVVSWLLVLGLLLVLSATLSAELAREPIPQERPSGDATSASAETVPDR